MGVLEVRSLQTHFLEPKRIDDIRQFFYSLLPYRELENRIVLQPTPEDIYSKLELSRKYRLASTLSDSARIDNITVVESSVRSNSSIPLYITVGTSKWYDGSNHTENIAGLSELLMFEQLRHLDSRVKSVYEPGLRIGLLCEDSTNKWLYGLQNDRELVHANNMRYIESLDGFASTIRSHLNLDITVRKESDVLREMGFMREDDCFHLYEQNQSLFYEFIKKSRIKEVEFLSGLGEWNDTLWQQYVQQVLPTIKEYHDLEVLGWSGGLHPKIREYYIKQFLKSTGKPMVDEDYYLAGYFAGVHTRKQLALMWWIPGEKPIKVAFLRYPEGSLKEKQNALQISQHPIEGYGSSHHHISPWASITGITMNKDGKYSLAVMPARSEERKTHSSTVELEYAGMRVPVPIYQKTEK